MKKALALVLCAAMTFGMLTGCGSKEAATEETAAATEETGEAEASETEDAATEEAAETEDAADAAADTTASDKKWVVATDTVFKPFEYTN